MGPQHVVRRALMNSWSLQHIDYQKPEDKPVDAVDFKLGHYPTPR